jgi:hypothetical protein
VTNAERIALLKDQLRAAMADIGRTGMDDDLRSLATQMMDGDHTVGEYDPETFAFHPLHDALIADYYLYLFAALEELRREEEAAERRGADAHRIWRETTFAHGGDRYARLKTIAKDLAVKVVVSGAGGGARLGGTSDSPLAVPFAGRGVGRRGALWPAPARRRYTASDRTEGVTARRATRSLRSFRYRGVAGLRRLG